MILTGFLAKISSRSALQEVAGRTLGLLPDPFGDYPDDAPRAYLGGARLYSPPCGHQGNEVKVASLPSTLNPHPRLLPW